ncbi:rab geranylgeranyltransferase alpha subunit [Mucor ambiguus]|uniref:Geranylgeranyl transferase type-2 subunit alpha n=1 Tax=Mucor ambiguus TaxID=91626 RepID=A0A0C9N471_9FUNG|nr:rab geranylgeranyltransferase alpha subunit [Mucor ambiguus]
MQHGRKREKTTEEVVKSRKAKEAMKIKEYNQLVDECREKMKNKEYNQDTFKLTSQLVEWNLDYYTIWNYRRILLQELVLKELDAEEQQKVYNKELILFLQLIKKNPKSYWMWNHRIWCLQNMPKPDWQQELGLVEKMLTMDARNFHGWDYRRFVVGHLRREASNDPEALAHIVQQEYKFTTQKINQSFSNYSAWHQRSKLLPEIVASMTAEEKNQVALNELDLVKNAIYTDPEDQSAWLYYWWLLGRAPDHVTLLGAYQMESDPSIVILGFNDNIRFMQKPRLLNEQDETVDCRLYPFDSNNQCAASIWILQTASTARRVVVDAHVILPSTSAKSIPHDKVWNLELDKLDCNIGSLASKLSDEWRPLATHMYTDPTLNDQTSWFTLDKLKLFKDEIETVRELLDIEPESAWALQTLVHFLTQLAAYEKKDQQSIYAEIVDILDKLCNIDSDRQLRYKDLKTHIIFKQLTSALVSASTNTYSSNAVEVLDLDPLDSIPLYSVLLLVPTIKTTNPKLESLLYNNLPLRWT